MSSVIFQPRNDTPAEAAPPAAPVENSEEPDVTTPLAPTWSQRVKKIEGLLDERGKLLDRLETAVESNRTVNPTSDRPK